MIYKILLIIDILLGALSQLILKKGMVKEGEVHIKFTKESFLRLIKMYLNYLVIFGSIVYALSIVLWVVVLSKIDLSYAYPLASLNYPFVALLSILIFKEKVSRVRWFSIGVIMVGVILVSLT